MNATPHPVLRTVATWYVDQAPVLHDGAGGETPDPLIAAERAQVPAQYQAALDYLVAREPDIAHCDGCWQRIGWVHTASDTSEVIWRTAALCQDPASPSSRVARFCETCAPDIGVDDRDQQLADEAARRAADVAHVTARVAGMQRP